MSVTSVEKDFDSLSLTLIADFDAPIERVWQLWADPRQLERWWGPPSHPATVEHHDLTPGGEVTYFMTGPGGEQIRGWWRVTSVKPPESLEFTDGYARQDGTPMESPITTVTMRLAEHAGGTRMELRFTYESREHMERLERRGAFAVYPQSVAQMDGLLRARTVHLALYDGLTDSEIGHLLVELHTGRFTTASFDVVTVAESRAPITTMGGLRLVPDALLADLEPTDSDLLVLPGAEMWDAGGGDVFTAAAARFLAAGTPVAAICGATFGLARAGLLDARRHTSASAEYLAMTGYAGASRYVDDRAVIDGDLITAGPQSPVQFARATLERLGVASERTLDAYEGLFHRGDPAAFPVLMQAQEDR